MKITGLLILMSLLVSGCAHDFQLIRKADLQEIEFQMQSQNNQLECISREQENLQNIMLADCSEMREQLQEIASMQYEQTRRQRELTEAARNLLIEQQKAVNAEKAEYLQGLSVPEAGEKQMVGAVEEVFLMPPGTMLPARVDTGAVTSSLDARNIVHFERNGDRWVRFAIINPEDESEIVLELELVRKVLIIQAEQEEAEKRPVVELGVTVGSHTQTAQFTLTDRRHMEFPVLIGRNILKDIMVVDVSQTHIAPPQPTPDPSEAGETP